MLQKIKTLPDSPGIYQFFDQRGKLLYVGKAKSLKNRVKSYFRFSPELSPAPNVGARIHKMVSEAANLEYIVLNSESDALILENSLIKQLKPKYNILLRDDKTYPYIVVDYDETYPRFEITRKIDKQKRSSLKYFGPFVSGARDLLDALYENYQLVQKASCLKGKKACMFYQIERCPAPCEFKIDRDRYLQTVSEAAKSINDAKGLIKKLETKMFLLSENFRFEEAAKLRDKISSIKSITIASEVDLANDDNFDMFAVAKISNMAVVVRFFIRGGKLVSSSHNFISTNGDNSDDDELHEIYSQALLEFYLKDHPFVAENIFVLHDIEDKELLGETISKHIGRKIKIKLPVKKEHKNIAAIAFKNGMELLRIKEDKNSISVQPELVLLCKLKRIPIRIEVFDNSHNAGDTPVASMVVWDDGFKKESYRHYNLEAMSEYEQMREALTKRVESFDKNPPPDMWLLDGGKANLSLAKSILESVGVDIDVVAIAKEKIDGKAHRAKGKADDILYTEDDIIKLPPSDRRLQFLQNLRDEAHRFAVSFHRKQKIKKDKQIDLMKLKGIKEGKIKRLLDFFGSFEAIQNASMEELARALNEQDSKKIFEHFNPTN